MKLKFIITLFCFCFLSFESQAQNTLDYSIKKASFNKNWKFILGEQEGAEKPHFDDSTWRSLDLPHDWGIEGPFDPKFNARSGGLPSSGTGWYRKTFTVPKELQGKFIQIEFDGVMYDSHVWINGHFLGNRPFGYMGFIYDLSPYLKYGSEENVIAVTMSPVELSSRWYPGAGIYRNVWMHIDDPIHIAHWGTFVTTPKITAQKAEVKIAMNVVNKAQKNAKPKLVAILQNQQGKELLRKETTFTIEAGKTEEISQFFTLKNPHLWDIDDPYLYKIITKIEKEGKIIDTYETPLGVRKLEFSAKEGFKLNGKYTKIQGVCMHHDLGPLGAAVNYRATERQLEIMKSMGVNSIRTSHNPASPELLELCDKMGILVQAEAFDVWRVPKVPNGYNLFFDEWHEIDLRDMIRRDRNHPSVIMWSIGNEILEQAKKDGWKTAKVLTEICHEEDPSRLVTAGFNNYFGAIKNGLAAQVDIAAFNYKPTKYEELIKEHPDWIIMGSETSSVTSTRGAYHLPIEKYKTHVSHQVTSYDLIGPVWAYPPDVEFEMQDKFPNVLGEYIWTGFDYLGEPTPYGGRDNSTNGYWNGDWPTRSSFFGAVDLCGFPKDRYFLYQSQWTKEPMVHVLPHWNWEHKLGEIIPVYAYTNCDEVELFVNGKSQGKKIKGKDCGEVIVDFKWWERDKHFKSPYRLRWDIPYQPGSLKVIGYKDGKALAEKEIKTAGIASKIKLVPDRQVIKADGSDLSFISVIVEDEEGNLCPWADNLIRFKVKGEGKIAAVGNGNPSTLAPFQADYRRAFYGKCMIIVKSKESSGKIEVEAVSELLEGAKVIIKTK